MSLMTPAEMDHVIAAAIRKHRRARGLSVRQLADECERLGAPQLTVSSLGNIERGQDPDAKRSPRRVGVAELAVLAAALHVAPIALAPFLTLCLTCQGTPPNGFACRTCGGEA